MGLQLVEQLLVKAAVDRELARPRQRTLLEQVLGQPTTNPGKLAFALKLGLLIMFSKFF